MSYLNPQKYIFIKYLKAKTRNNPSHLLSVPCGTIHSVN